MISLGESELPENIKVKSLNLGQQTKIILQCSCTMEKKAFEDMLSC